MAPVPPLIFLKSVSTSFGKLEILKALRSWLDLDHQIHFLNSGKFKLMGVLTSCLSWGCRIGWPLPYRSNLCWSYFVKAWLRSSHRCYHLSVANEVPLLCWLKFKYPHFNDLNPIDFKRAHFVGAKHSAPCWKLPMWKDYLSVSCLLIAQLKPI